MSLSKQSLVLNAVLFGTNETLGLLVYFIQKRFFFFPIQLHNIMCSVPIWLLRSHTQSVVCFSCPPVYVSPVNSSILLTFSLTLNIYVPRKEHLFSLMWDSSFLLQLSVGHISCLSFYFIIQYSVVYILVYTGTK